MLKWFLNFFHFPQAQLPEVGKSRDERIAELNLEPITLTLAEVKAKAKDYYDRCLLGAQHKAGCQNFYHAYPDVRCAVSCCYPDRFNQELLTFATSTKMIEVKLLIIDPEEAVAIRNIQSAHDDWAVAEIFGYVNAESMRAHFLSLLT